MTLEEKQAELQKAVEAKTEALIQSERREELAELECQSTGRARERDYNSPVTAKKRLAIFNDYLGPEKD